MNLEKNGPFERKKRRRIKCVFFYFLTFVLCYVNFFELLSCKSYVGLGTTNINLLDEVISKLEKKKRKLVGKIRWRLNLRVYNKF